MYNLRPFAVALVLFAFLSAESAAQTELSRPFLVVSDRTARNVVRFDPHTGARIDTLNSADIGGLDAIVFGPDQNLYVATGGSGAVLKYNGSTGEYMGTFVQVGPVYYAAGLAFGPDGNLYVSSSFNDRVLRFDGLSGDYLGTFIAEGAGGLDQPVYLLFGPDDLLYVGSQLNHQVLRYDAWTGEFVDQFIGPGSGSCPDGDPVAGEGGLCGPWGLTFGPDGNFYVASVLNGNVLRYDSDGNFMDTFVSGLDLVTELAFSEGSLYLGTRVGEDRAVVHRYDATTGAFQGVFASTGIQSVHGLLFYSWESTLSETGDQSAVATNAFGNRVVAWTDSDGNGTGVFAQRFDPNGESVGSRVRVNSTVAGNQHTPAVAMADDGRFVVVWLGGGSPKTAQAGDGVFGRFFSPDGSPQGGEVDVSGETSGEHSSPDVAHTAARVATVWTTHSAAKSSQAGNGVFGRLFTGDGTPETDPFQVDSTGQASSAAVALVDSRPYVVWNREGTKSAWPLVQPGGDGVFGRLFGTDGNPAGSEVTLDDGSAGTPGSPDVDAGPAANPVVVWDREPTGGGSSGIFGRQLGSSGSPIGATFQVNIDTERDQTDPEVATNPAGQFAVTWQSEKSGGGSGVFGRLFDPSDGPGRTEILVVDTDSADDFVSPDVGLDAVGNLTVLFDRKSDGAGAGVLARTTEIVAENRGCIPNSTTLCLNDQRFMVTVSWIDFQGNSGSGRAASLTTDTGTFWFFDQTNVELVVKVLDGTAINGYFWVFYGALSNVEYTITIVDTMTGRTTAYTNPSGTFASVGDTEALPGAGAHAARATTTPASDVAPSAPREAATATLAACTPGPNTLCLNNNRFRLEVSWSDFQGNTGVGRAEALTADTGTFWFFDSANVELVVKVLDATTINGHYWVFYGALSNVAYTITVTDTATGAVKQYTNPLGQFGSVGDTEAFPVP